VAHWNPRVVFLFAAVYSPLMLAPLYSSSKQLAPKLRRPVTHPEFVARLRQPGAGLRIRLAFAQAKTTWRGNHCMLGFYVEEETKSVV
jgi:hypothetical protein